MTANEVREQIIQSMAHTFFISNLADAIDGAYDANLADAIDGAYDEREMTSLSKLGRPWSGKSWESVYPPHLVPRSALELARRCAHWVEMRSGVNLGDAYARCLLRKIDPKESATPEAFGYCLAMEITGTGVSWADSHDEHGLDLPHVEVCLDLVGEVVNRITHKEGEQEFSLVTQARFHLSWSSREIRDW